MINYFLVVVVVTFCLQMYSYTSSLGKVRRVFEGLDYSVVQGCVNGLQNQTSANTGPCFVYSLLNSTVGDYFSTNLSPKYSRDKYEYEITLTDPYVVDGTAMNRFKGTVITFKIEYFSGYLYSNQKKFIIKEKI